ncbi:MAG: Uma2 family endonuclease [Blastocatellia bacterium]
MLPAVKHYPISVQMYHYMAEEGVFAPDERVELIDGEIIEMSPIGSLHARCVNFLTEYLTQLLFEKFRISVQNPIVLGDDSEPQPDIAILRYKEDFYKDILPTATDVVLVIEVGDTSAGFDRTRKIPKYAAAGIPEAWLVDLEDERVEVHSIAKDTTYGLVKIYQRGEYVVSETMPDLRLSVDSILG